MLNGILVKRIKTLQRAAGVDDDSYRAMLAGYGVESCRDLDAVQAASVISFLQVLVDGSGNRRPRRSTGAKRYEDLDGRSAEWATSKQLRMLEAMWMDVTRQKTREKAMLAYHSWLMHKFGLTSAEMIAREDVGKVKMALASMRKKSVAASSI